MFKYALLLSLTLFLFLGGPAHAQDKVQAWIAKLQSGSDAEKVAAAVALADLGAKAEPAVPALVATLQGKSEDLRLNSALALGKIGAPAVKPIAGMLSSANTNDRFYAAWTLGMIGPAAKETTSEVIKLLADNDVHVRRKAAFALGRIAPEPKAAVGPLIRLFADANNDVRQSASEALAKFGVQAVPALIDALKDESPSIRSESARALGHIGADARDAIPHLKTLFLAADKASFDAADALGKIGKASIPALTECLKNDNTGVRTRAVQTLGKIGADAVPTLVDALGEKNADVRQNAAAMLAPLRINDKMVVLALAHGVHDPDQAVRRQCLLGLQNLGTGAKLAAPKLIDAVRRPELGSLNRLQILQVLQNIGDAEKEILPVAAVLIKDDDMQVRMSAVNLLGNQGSAALPHLIAALKDNNQLVRFSAVNALQRIPGDIKDALPDLVPLLKEGAPFQRRSVVFALGRVGAPAVPTLIELLGDKENVVRLAAIDAVRNVGPEARKAVTTLSDLVLQDTYLAARRNAVMAVATIEPEKLGDLFARVQKHNDEKVRLTAYQGLYFRAGKKGAVTALPAKVSLPHLLEAAKDGAASIRLIAAQGLGSLGADAKDAVPVLMALTQDADVNVRKAATQALAQIKGKS